MEFDKMKQMQRCFIELFERKRNLNLFPEQTNQNETNGREREREKTKKTNEKNTDDQVHEIT